MPLPVSGQQDFAVEFYKYMDSEFPASPELQCPQFIFFVNFKIAEMISNLFQTYFDLWDFLRTYATQSAFMSPGPFHFRPFMLPHRHDFGLRGTADWDPCLNQPKCHNNIKHWNDLKPTSTNHPEEIVRLLTQLMVLKGCLTCPDLPGCEKLCVTPVQKSWLKEPAHVVTCADLGIDPLLLGPGQAFMVKGWNRAICCLIVMLATYECEELRQARGG